MAKSTKNQHSRERMWAAIKQSKQTTLDTLPNVPQKESTRASESERKKQIIITEIGTVTKEDELALEVWFSLLPSKAAFSKITSDLYFDGQRLNSACISIPQSQLATDEFEFTPVLDMKGISAGLHIIKVEMYELWSSGEKLTCASKEVAVEYIPISRERRLIKVPIVKSIAGTDLAIVSGSEKGIYHEIEESMKKESISKRDEW
jgi:hypothetical protein